MACQLWAMAASLWEEEQMRWWGTPGSGIFYCLNEFDIK